MPDLKHARMMLKMAGKDLTTLRIMENSDEAPLEIVGFHAQQAVEKALKAWLALLDIPYPKIHDLGEIFGLIATAGGVIDDRFAELTDLTDFAVQFRHEAFEELIVDIEKKKITQKVKDLLTHVELLVEKTQAGS